MGFLKTNLEGLILRKDIFQQCLVLYPESVWDAMVDAIVQRTNPFDSKGRAAMRGFVAGAEKISIDGNGRILIPRRYLESADIQGEVRFIGMDDSIEIWNRQKAENLLNNPEALADRRKTRLQECRRKNSPIRRLRMHSDEESFIAKTA